MDKLQEVLQREPIERSVLNGSALRMRDPAWDAGMFVKLTMDPEKQTPPDLIEYVRHEIERTCAADAGEDEAQYQAYMKGLDALWPALKRKMELSYGLAEYMRTLACHSLFLPRYYATLYHPMALEAPFGWAVRIDGVFMPIPRNDPSYVLCATEPIFDTARVRTARQQLVQLELGDGATVVSLGSAMLPEYNHFGWQERNVRQKVVAYDNVAGVMDCLKQVYKEPLESYGIDYRNETYWNAFEDSSLQKKVDLLAIEGGLSYVKDRTDELLVGATKILKPGGHFCGEVELKHLYTIRCGILGWQMDQPMQFDDTVESAIERMEAAATRNGFKVVEACPDERSASPAMVWFHLQKL